MSSESTQHRYIAATAGDSRSPCPALNALANHDYIPHDGRNIGLWQLTFAVQAVYNLSLPLAFVLSLGGVLLCGRWWSLSLDLHDLAHHNRIEHDGSLAHADALPGQEFAPTTVAQSLLRQLLTIPGSDRQWLTLEDFADARILRGASMRRRLDPVHAEIAHGEVALTLKVFGVAAYGHGPDGHQAPGPELAVPKDVVEEWFGHNRLPAGWHKPSKPVGLLATMAKSKEVGGEIARLESLEKGVRKRT